jgi:hypothetical protein
MKNAMNFLAVLTLIFLTLGCNKQEKLAISYPTNGLNGINVLALTSDSLEVAPVNYSMNAVLGEKAQLKIVITKLASPSSNSVWFYDAMTDGWIGGDFDGTSQEFISTKTGNIDLDLEFQGQGTCRIDYYENSKTVTKSKVFSW